jgi:hypothetical protein
MKKILFFIPLILLIVVSCKKTEELGEAPRLFRPILQGQLSADSNTIIAAWQKIAGAKNYQFQISKDTFKTIERNIIQDTNVAVIKGLLFNQLYQVQVKALAPDSTHNSAWSNLGAIKTLTSILKNPAIDDITFNSVRVKWTTKGAPVSSIKILKTSDGSVAAQANLTPADLTNELKVMTGLSSATLYTIQLFSGTDLRGYVDFTTKAPFAGTVIDLTGITGRPSVLSDTIPIIPSGSTILLKRGEQYNISSSVALNKTLIILSGPDLSVTSQAKIYFTSNFSLTAGATIDSLEFNDVYMYSDNYGSRYVFNNTNNVNIGKIKFMNSRVEIFRGIMRLQSNTAVINNLIIDNCIIDSLAGYGVLTVDVVTSKVDNIYLTNSTIYKVEKVFTSKNNSTNLLIESCTFNEAPLGGGSNYLIDYSTAGTNNVTNGITINNCIFGPGKTNPSNNTTVRDIRVGTTTTQNASNNFRTTDRLSAAAANDIPSIITYNRTAPQLFTDPTTGNFKINDVTFPGRSNSGDPRWRL